MSATVSRLVLSIALLACVPGLWCLVFFPLYRLAGGRDDPWILVTHAVVAGVFMAAWILIWRTQIAWTAPRMIWTAVAGPLAVVPAALIGLLVAVHGDDDVGLVTGGMAWVPLWIGATAIIWRDQPLEEIRRQRPGVGLGPHCPQCNYNLSGLSEARCPECGTQYTLDELFAAATAVGRLD